MAERPLDLLKHVSIENYEQKFNNRDNKRGGIVGMYIRKSMVVKKRHDITSHDNTIENMWMDVKGKKYDSFLLAVLNQSSSTVADERTWLAKIDSLLAYVSTIWTGPIIITGDTNVGLLETDSNIVAEYNNVLQNHGLKQHITKATRKDAPSLIISLPTSAR